MRTKTKTKTRINPGAHRVSAFELTMGSSDQPVCLVVRKLMDALKNDGYIVLHDVDAGPGVRTDFLVSFTPPHLSFPFHSTPLHSTRLYSTPFLSTSLLLLLLLLLLLQQKDVVFFCFS
ncbi:hypothetical protein M0802_012864 [Mischocyttarus mexicanus]|nr:hypothetical protein M0802_012864 [Mischocyttarus mexicanus]